MELLDENPVQPGQSFGMAYSIVGSSNGNTWIGCFPGFYQLRQEQPGRSLQPVFEDIPLWEPGADPANLSAWAAVERPAGILWVATFKGGLKRVNLKNGKVAHFRHQPGKPASISHDKVFSLFADEQQNKLWIGTERGLDWIALDELEAENTRLVFHHLESDERLAGNEITSINRGPGGLLWIGTTRQGLLIFDPLNERVVEQFQAEAGREGSINRSFINTVFTDSRGRHWVATGMGGLCQAMPTGEGEESYAFRCYLEGMYIVDIFEGAGGKLWLAAMNYGIAIFDPETGEHELWNMENHLKRNSVLGIEQDEGGKLWFTSLGLTRYDPQSGAFRSFGKAAGVQDEDPGRLLLPLKDGRMVYSSINGWLQVFNPAEVMSNPNPARVVVTGVQYYDPGQKANVPLPLKENIEVAEEVSLQYSQQPFYFEFTGLEFNDPAGIRYASMLDGYENQWNYSQERASGRYLQVPPGKYTFLLRAANSDGLWMDEPLRLRVTIIPPWWRTNAAFLAYGLILALFIYFIFAFQRRRLRLRAQLEFEQREAARLKELDAVKTRFFTDIAHEFRTPLTVIGGMAGEIQEKPAQWLEMGLGIIQRHTRQLLRLANQLLDLSKLEAGSMEVNMIQGDIMLFMRAAVEPFATLAAAKGIRWRAELRPEQLEMDYEPEKLQQILSNLLSNALKFTPKGETITVKSQEVDASGKPHLEFTAEDTGRGIPAEELPFIFDRGFRGQNSAPGAGIGLALTRELVHLLGGAIEAHSPEGAGAFFRILLPIHRQAPREAAAPLPQPEEILPEGTEPTRPATPGQACRLLIVEDNHGMVAYLSSILSASFKLTVAKDGKEGLRKAIRKVPDIIISDIMMPEMDGLEFCRRLKADRRASHIPVLLLTARADAASRTEGHRAGADAYLPKPFDKKELLAQLQQLIDNRKRLQRHYRESLKQPDTPAAQPQQPDKEKEFLIQARKVVANHLSDTDFGPRELRRELNMSKTQLHNKLSALTGRSTTLFIRSIRLKHAKEALEATPGMTVTQAAFDFGFKDPNYFSRVFKKEFGVAPKDIRL